MPRHTARRILTLALLCTLLIVQAPPAMAEPGPEGATPAPAAEAPGTATSGDSGPGEAAAPAAGPYPDEAASLAAYRAAQADPASLPNEAIYSVAGSDFHPRSSSVKADYRGGGCVSRLGTSGQEDPNAFTAPLNLPDGATILGIRLLGYDSSASTSELQLVSYTYDFEGDLVVLAVASSDGHSGYFTQYASLLTPVVVDTISESLSLVWYNGAADTALRLCAARVYYTVPPPPSAGSRRRTYITGADLVPEDSGTLYQYGGAGSLWSTGGGSFAAYADMPDGAALVGLYLKYADTSVAGALAGAFLAHDAAGSTAVFASGTNGSTSGGEGTVYVTVDPPRLVDESSVAPQVSVTLPADANVRLLSVQLAWNAPGPAAVRHRFIPGAAFGRRDDSTVYTDHSGGCVSVTAGTADLTHALHLPHGARILGLRLYTYDASATDSTLTLTRYDGAGGFEEPLVLRSQGAGGYGNVGAGMGAGYVVDTYYPHSLVWHPSALGSTLRLCGVRVDYATSAVLLPVAVR
jgi:hypothetical protein